MKNIRNFCIIAHIDHGKSTLADCFIKRCGGLQEREMSAQVLDSMEVERERGITVKAQSVRLNYQAKDGQTYQLNLIDTPGHVDFSYEVSRSLAACEGALLVVDAAQGVEAQTVAVCYHAIEQNLDIVPVLNKVDLPQADCEATKQAIEDIIGIPTDYAIAASAKAQIGIDDILEAVVHHMPAPQGNPEAPLQALIIDSWFDPYLGVVSLVRIMNGMLRRGDAISVMSTGKHHLVDQCGVFTPKRHPLEQLNTGEVGYVVANIRDIHGAPVGDTLTLAKGGATTPWPDFQKIQPRVYAGLFTVNSDDFQDFREALAKLALNDAALAYEPEKSEALGFGFRCGFLGMLHMEIIQERLEREYNLDLITTTPNVIYEITLKSGDIHYIHSPSELPDPAVIAHIAEPIARVNILTPQDHLGDVIRLCIERRGQQKQMQYLGNQVSLAYDLPMNEIVMDFFDRLKSVSKGYASSEFTFDHFAVAPMVKLDILINGDRVDALSSIVHRERAYGIGRALAKKLKSVISRQMFAVAIQAAIGSHIIARETVSAMRKNVTAKCYGGDITRKRKLLEKQKAGKKRMKQIGKVTIPQEAFLAILQVNDDTGS